MTKIKCFEDVFRSLMYIQDATPRKVGVKELMDHTGLKLRTQQQTMKDLKEAGYVSSDGETPIGYTVNMDKIQELFHVKQGD